MWPEIVHAKFWIFIYEIWLWRLMLRYYLLNTKVCAHPQPASLFYDVTTPHWNQCAAFNAVCWFSSFLREKSNILQHFFKLFASVMPRFLVKRLFRHVSSGEGGLEQGSPQPRWNSGRYQNQKDRGRCTWEQSCLLLVCRQTGCHA